MRIIEKPLERADVVRVRRLLDQARSNFGSRQDVARWFRAPAIGLEGRRPIDLLWTKDGLNVLEVLLGRIEYSVYT